MAENERWGFYVSRGEPLVIALARSFLFAEKKIFSANVLSDSQIAYATLIIAPVKVSKAPPLHL